MITCYIFALAKAEPTPAADVVSTDDPLQPAKSEPLGKPKSSVSVGKVSNSPLGINPLALMPGAAPPRKEQASAAVGFDTPAVTTNVLHSMNKVRFSALLHEIIINVIN